MPSPSSGSTRKSKTDGDAGVETRRDLQLVDCFCGNQFSAPEPLKIPPTPYSPVVTVTDWNGDGDDDVIVGTAYGFFCWFERSFLDHGYARAELIKKLKP